jgi:TatD DNase family protein
MVFAMDVSGALIGLPQMSAQYSHKSQKGTGLLTNVSPCWHSRYPAPTIAPFSWFPSPFSTMHAHHPLIDIGVNLGHDSFDHDRHAVIAAARAAGVGQMIVTGTSVPASIKAAELAGQHPGILFSTAGVHPHDASSFGIDTSAMLHRMLQQPQVVAVGETGLDFNRDFSPRPLQEQAFAEQLALAGLTQLPIFLHQRDAHARFMALLKEQRDKVVRGVVHCFTGTRDELRDYLDLDMYIGITGWICDERRGLELQGIVKDIPLDRLMLETDAPYLTPRNIEPKARSRRNEPAHLPWVLAMVAHCTGRDSADVAAATTRNAKVFFGL